MTALEVLALIVTLVGTNCVFLIMIKSFARLDTISRNDRRKTERENELRRAICSENANDVDAWLLIYGDEIDPNLKREIMTKRDDFAGNNQ